MHTHANNYYEILNLLHWEKGPGYLLNELILSKFTEIHFMTTYH